MKQHPKHLLLALLTTVALVAAGCVEDGDVELATAEVSLVATSAANVASFDLLIRPVGSPTWTTRTLTPTLVGTDAEAGSVVTLVPGDYVFRAEAYDGSGTLLGQPREVVVALLAGASTAVDIRLDLAGFGEGEDQASAEVSIRAQNGADIDQSTLGNDNPTDVVPATITIDAVSDFEGDAVRTGFVSEASGATEFFSGTTTSFTFNLPAAPGSRSVFAIAVDDAGQGTAHAYEFDPSVTPSFTGMTIYRVNDMATVNAASTNIMVLSNDAPSLLVWADADGDMSPDFGFQTNETLLSWGISPTDPNLYELRWQDAGGIVTRGTLDMLNGVPSSILE